MCYDEVIIDVSDVRDNMCIKYGKGYAMEETTLLFCDFSEGITDAQKVAQKREKWSMFFGIYDPERKDVTLLLYRTPNDIRKGVTKAVAPGQKAGFIHMEPLIEIRKEPLVVNPSPFVMDASKVKLNKNCQAQAKVRSPKVQSPKVKTKGTLADTKITRV